MLRLCPSMSIEPSCTANTWIDSLRVSSPVTGERLPSSSRLDASVRPRARDLPSSSNSAGTGLSTFRQSSLNRCWSKGLRGRSHHSTSPWGNCEKADLQTSRVFATRCLCLSREEVEAFSVRRLACYSGTVPSGVFAPQKRSSPYRV